jgi:tRNA(fMet)-specific endonuclease VapC
MGMEPGEFPPIRILLTIGLHLPVGSQYCNSCDPGIPIIPYDQIAVIWHEIQRAQFLALWRIIPFAVEQIAAIASTNNLILVTRNTKDFSCINGLIVTNWFSSP